MPTLDGWTALTHFAGAANFADYPRVEGTMQFADEVAPLLTRSERAWRGGTNAEG